MILNAAHSGFEMTECAAFCLDGSGDTRYNDDEIVL